MLIGCQKIRTDEKPNTDVESRENLPRINGNKIQQVSVRNMLRKLTRSVNGSQVFSPLSPTLISRLILHPKAANWSATTSDMIPGMGRLSVIAQKPILF